MNVLAMFAKKPRYSDAGPLVRMILISVSMMPSCFLTWSPAASFLSAWITVLTLYIRK